MIQRDTDKGLIDIACQLRHETERAYLVDVGGAKPIWLAKSQVEYFDDGKGGIVTMKYWLAKEKELI